MSEENKIRLTILATKLTELNNGGSTINGDADRIICSLSALNDIGKKLMEIVENELNQKAKADERGK